MYYLIAQEFLNGILINNWYIEDPTGKRLEYKIYSVAFAKAKMQSFEVNAREIRVFVVCSEGL